MNFCKSTVKFAVKIKLQKVILFLEEEEEEEEEGHPC
jgi:hypothetical protein